MTTPVLSSVRALRIQAGWSQARLGESAGLTRQSIAAIEAGRAVPSTEVALRLARALGVEVERLFRLRDVPEPEELADDAGFGPASATGPVRLARVAGRTLAYGTTLGSGDAGLADGVGMRSETGQIRISPFRDRPRSPDLVVVGCDPAFPLVRDRLRAQGTEVLWLRAGSRTALDALARGVAHVAGIHLKDPATGAYNEPWVRRHLPFPATRAHFATWEQALLLRPGNPLSVRSLEDLARPGIRFINREPGSGSRTLLEEALRARGIEELAVPGFGDTAADGHDTVARAVASGVADAGVAIRASGHELGLAMLPLAEEPYELVIPDPFLELHGVPALLRELERAPLRDQVGALAGYDTGRMGNPA